MNISSLLLASLGLLLSSFAFANLNCISIHQNGVSIPGLYATFRPEEFGTHQEKIKQLASKLIEANRDRLTGNMRHYDIKIVNQEVPKVLAFTRFELNPGGSLYYEATAQFLDHGADQYLEIRTNGNVAFISRSYRYRIDAPGIKHYDAVYFDGNEIKVMDQGELILSTLPEKMYLSRSMSPTERKRWLDDEPFWSNYGAKVHFAPNFYKFRDDPYRIEFTKQQLLDFYHRNEIEVNTYDPGGGKLPPSMVMTDLGLEFEIVFVGDKAIENLRPIIKKDIKQERLRF